MNRMRKVWVALHITAGLSGWAALTHAAQVSTPDASRGQAVAAVCAACHGADGNSAAETFPKLAGQHAGYIVKQLGDFKAQSAGGQPVRTNPIMAGMASALSDQQVVDVAAYFASQTPKPGDAQNKDTFALGQKIYRGGIADKGVPACAGCHGPTGQGIPSQYPRLSGQWAAYTTAQLTAFTQGAGARDNSVPMHAIASRLSDSEIKAVADYISGLR
ncbi:c-type cytochrome [Paraburkholderia dinghuensis]|uniref:Cytochrome c4 n=1 Tax=Paraburkholderia dinghuensis TaxID=2305225 RepID=A0A3N6N738_9BURK|nr:c-type cytochrome [Paraburkholderia dinghuensis]RQH03867.1 cytochrome c4 [Paraburkholderia dinghuensis]